MAVAAAPMTVLVRRIRECRGCQAVPVNEHLDSDKGIFDHGVIWVLSYPDCGTGQTLSCQLGTKRTWGQIGCGS